MKNKKLVIFGAGDIAELAHYYFTNDSDYVVEAFTVDRSFIKEETVLNLPVVAFDEVSEIYPPDQYDLFIALSYAQINQLRKDKYTKAKQIGYKLASYISSKASILNEGRVGDNCFILEDNTVQPFVEIGNNVTLWSGNHIGHHSCIKNHVFIASHVVISGRVQVHEQCFIGVNATLRDNISIGAKSVIGAGALILQSADDESLFVGEKTEKSKIPTSKLRKI